jgi:prepilin peptidase CpaA
MDSSLLKIGALALAVGACVCDLRTRRIPNELTLGAALLAVVAQTLVSGVHGLAFSALGWLLGLALFLPFFLLRGMGAGDVKLLAALGAWLGPTTLIWAVVYTAFAGGCLALALAASRGCLARTVLNLAGAFVYWGTSGPAPVPGLTLETTKGPKLPYAVPILIGTVAALWIR